MSARKRLPKEIFVRWEDLDGDDPYLTAAQTITEHADKSAKVLVGTYRLVREDNVVLVTKVSQRKVRS